MPEQLPEAVPRWTVDWDWEELRRRPDGEYIHVDNLPTLRAGYLAEAKRVLEQTCHASTCPVRWEPHAICSCELDGWLPDFLAALDQLEGQSDG